MPSDVFLISPIGARDSDIRREADMLQSMARTAVEPAGTVHRADTQRDVRITDAIIRSLDTASMVIGYLGRPPWNANVFFEVGYRWANRKPVLLLSHEKDDLPFDLQDIRQFRLPPDRLDQLPAVDYNRVTQDLTREIAALRQPVMHSSYAVAEMLIDLTRDHDEDERRQRSIFTMSSREADELFHVPGTLTGMRICDAKDRLEPLVIQWDEFDRQQRELLGALLQGNSSIDATIPFIFKNVDAVEERYRDRAYLALIVQKTLIATGLLLRVLYYKVPAPLLKVPSANGDYYECDLTALPPDLIEARDAAKAAHGK